MRCPSCAAEINEEAAFCQACGAKVGALPLAGRSAGKGAAAEADWSPDDGGLRSPSGRRDDPEVELWTGGYSPKAMIGSFIGAAALTVAILIASMIFPLAIWLLLAAGVVWLLVLGMLAYRRLNIHYRLTSQRFFHQKGILTRTTDRIEVIEMDDVTYTQSIFERMFGVGTIKITSSDSTHPVLIMTGIDKVQEVSEIIDKARRKEITRRGLRIESV